MDANKEFKSVKKEHKIIIDDLNHCCLCGEKLSFCHKVDYLKLRVVEEAHCPECRIRLKASDHTIH